MWALKMTGIMARRLLVNWRVPDECLAAILPGGMRPKLVNGHAIVGLCLVRLERLRPLGLPAFLGLASENVAFRVGVEWDTEKGPTSGVMILRRDTASRVNMLCAERAGYGLHHRAEVRAFEDGRRVDIHVDSSDGGHTSRVNLHAATGVQPGSAFASMAEAEAFFRGGECGYSPSRRPGRWNGARLHLHRWDLRPMHVRQARCSLIEDWFGEDARVDSAFILRNIPHTWTPLGERPFGVLRQRPAALACA